MPAISSELTPRWMVVKAVLFVVIVVLAATILLLQSPTWTTAACAVAIAWGSSRAYYFAFHVIEKWIDPGHRFTGMVVLAAWAWRRRRVRPPA